MNAIRVAIVGLGANTRRRHVPGLGACESVEIVGVCNRRPESTARAAAEFHIPRTYERWQQLIDDPDVDAVVIGTWPYLHCEITLAAFEAGKHVLTEARMAANAAEAHRMLAAHKAHPELIAQVVPSPLGLRTHRAVQQHLEDNFLGTLREVVVQGTDSQYTDPRTPRHWRQSASFSGVNMLALGILHEPLIRWLEDPVRVLAQTHIFTRQRRDPETHELVEVETPDTVRVLTELPCGARGLYHLSGVVHHGPPMQATFYGSDGTLHCDFAGGDRLFAARAGQDRLHEVILSAEQEGGWRVEQEFINAIRGLESVRFTDFATGVRYMEFTEAVARSAAEDRPCTLPLVGTG